MVKIRVNGEWKELPDVDPAMPLLWLIRDELELTGTKYSCGQGQCGSCTVQLDGKPVRACLVPVEQADGLSLTTIEGLVGEEADALRAAWHEHQVPQCGFCQAGQLMSAEHLLRTKTSKEVGENALLNAMSGNLCRCGTYNRINQAIRSADKELGS
jgi:isoquinoline 1-oxidoreductase subunit alpha